MLTILRRVLRTTGHNLIRHSLVNLTATLIIALLFLLLNGLIVVKFSQTAAMTAVQSQLDLALTFRTPVERFQITAIDNDLTAAFPAIRRVSYISPDQAFASFLTDFESVNRDLSTWLAQNTTQSPLPATLVIAADPALHQPILDWLTRSRYAKLIDTSTATRSDLAVTATKNILAIDRTLTRVGIVTGIAFVGLAVLIIIAVVRLAISTRTQEIAIMRLVGATQSYIQLPFILEGIFFAVVASLIGVVSCFAILTRIDQTTFTSGIFGGIGELIRDALTAYTANIPLIIGWQLIAAIIVGAGASIIATHRHLRQDVLLG